jgi:DNA-3-methyladenine glycosylase II
VSARLIGRQALTGLALAHGYDTAFWWIAGIFACGAVVGGVLLRRGPLGQQRPPSPAPGGVTDGTSRGEPGAGSVTGDSSRAAWLRQARSYLRNADPVLARLIDERPEFDPRAWMTQLPPMDLYGALLFQVTGQQLSVAATRRTLARIEACSAVICLRLPNCWPSIPASSARPGCRGGRIATLRDLAERMSDGRLDPEVLSGLPDDELLAQLTAISGIGPWTVQGAMLIALGREDVVLPGDLALRKAVQAAYRLDHLPAPQEVLDIA